MKTKFFLAVVSMLFLWHTTIAQLPDARWAKSVGSGCGAKNSSGKGHALFTDTAGNVYTTGTAASGDIFIQKTDASGNVFWAKRIGAEAPNKSSSTAIAVDTKGNVFTVGIFRGTIDFDPGQGIFNATSAGAKDIFIQKLDASGNFMWAKSVRLNPALNGSFVASRTGGSGKVYTKRAFAKATVFNTGEASGITNTPYALGNAFTIKLDAVGNFVWSSNAASTGLNKGDSLNADAPGNIYYTGTFAGDFDTEPLSIVGKAGLIEAGKTSFGFYPNPTKGNFVINMKLNEDVTKDAIIQVYNAQGKLVSVNNIAMVHGVMFKEMKLDKTLAAGLYQMRITVNNKIVQQQQFIYQR